MGLNIDEHTRVTQLTDVLSLLSPRQRKTSPQRLVLTGMLMGFFFFSLCRPFSFIRPYGPVSEHSSSHQLSVALPPSLTAWIGVQTITLLVSLYLPLRSPLSPLFPLSLSLLLRRFAVLPEFWLVLCNRLNPFLSSEGRYFLLFWLYPLLPDSDCDTPCGAVVIWRKKKKASTTLLHRGFKMSLRSTHNLLQSQRGRLEKTAENPEMMY